MVIIMVMPKRERKECFEIFFLNKGDKWGLHVVNLKLMESSIPGKRFKGGSYQ